MGDSVKVRGRNRHGEIKDAFGSVSPDEILAPRKSVVGKIADSVSGGDGPFYARLTDLNNGADTDYMNRPVRAAEIGFRFSF